jgi:hypothetical protein
VQEEADDAKRRGVLVPILIENVQAPFGFRSIQVAHLVDWDGTESTQAFRRLIADIAALIELPPKKAKKEDRRSESEVERKTEADAKRRADEEESKATEAAEPRGKAERTVFVSYPKDIAPELLKRLGSALIKGGFRLWLYDPRDAGGFPDEELEKISWQQSGVEYEEQKTSCSAGLRRHLVLDFIIDTRKSGSEKRAFYCSEVAQLCAIYC